MSKTNPYAVKDILLGSAATVLAICAAYVEFLGRNHMMHFQSMLGGSLYILSSFVVLLAGIVLSWVIPMNTQMTLRQATKKALIVGLIPALTLILRILQWMLIAPPFNYAIRNWTMLSTAPPLWMGLTLGWWLQVWRRTRSG